MIRKWIGWQQRQLEQQEEEESSTQYESSENPIPPEPSTQNGLTTEPPKDWRRLGWEFKIVRAKRNVFRNPAILNRICVEEAEAGWVLLEKLDDQRLRFKRPMVLRELIKPETLNRDPYRCYYRSPVNLLAFWLWTFTLLAVIILPAYLGYVFVSKLLTQPDGPSPATSPAPSLPVSPTLPSPQ